MQESVPLRLAAQRGNSSDGPDAAGRHGRGIAMLAAAWLLAGCGASGGGSSGTMATFQAGSPCSSEAATTCGVAGYANAVLVCHSGSWQTQEVCPGSGWCGYVSGQPVCMAAGSADATGTPDGAASEDAAKPIGCGKPADCDDGDPCTADTCVPTTKQCAHDKLTGCAAVAQPCGSYALCPSGTVCDDPVKVCVQCLKHSDCGVGNRCAEHHCYTSVACQSDVQCKGVGGVCDTVAGVCVPCKSDTDCSQGQQCTQGGCVAALTCKSSKDCPAVCDSGTGLCAGCLKDADCPTGQFCSQWHTCTPAVCTGDQCIGNDLWQCFPNGAGFSGSKSCDDNNPCTSDSCAQGKCVFAPLNSTIAACNDDNPCTFDECKAGVCVHPTANDGISCDDGNTCTTADTCKVGTCAGTAMKCDDGDPCTNDACVGGSCKSTPSGSCLDNTAADTKTDTKDTSTFDTAKDTSGGAGKCAPSNSTCLNTCMQSKCDNEITICAGDPKCAAISSCLSSCSGVTLPGNPATSTCQKQCTDAAGVLAMEEYFATQTCIGNQCITCEPGDSKCEASCGTVLCAGAAVSCEASYGCMAILECIKTQNCLDQACVSGCMGKSSDGQTEFGNYAMCYQSNVTACE